MKKARVAASMIIVMAMAIVAMACSSDEKDPVATLKVNSVSLTGAAPAEGCDVTVDVQASAEPKLNVSVDWIGRGGVQQSGTTYTYTLNIKPNTGAARTGKLLFTLGNESATVDIAQAEFVPAPEPEPEPEPVPAGDMPLLGLGWNLGNHMDAYNNNVAGETSWGNPKSTQALFDKIAADGLTTVRIPVTWLGKVGAAPDYKIDAAWLNRVAEIVGYAEKAGLKAIVNIHHDGADTGKWLDVKKAANDADFKAGMFAQFTAMWQQIAEKFADKGDFLVFEPFNELHDGGWGWGDNRKDGGKQYAIVNELNQVFVNTVRATGGKNATRWLGVPGYCTNPDLTMENLVLPTDPTPDRLMVAVHFYDPTTFTLEAKFTDWGHTGTKGKKETWGDEDNVRNVFGKLKKKYVDNGIPVYIGEGGCVHMSTDRAESFRKYYLEYVAKAARDNGLSFIIWDNGSKTAGKECHGYYNHGTGEYINNAAEMISVLVKGYYTNDPAYTLQSVYNSAPTF